MRRIGDHTEEHGGASMEDYGTSQEGSGRHGNMATKSPQMEDKGSARSGEQGNERHEGKRREDKHTPEALLVMEDGALLDIPWRTTSHLPRWNSWWRITSTGDYSILNLRSSGRGGHVESQGIRLDDAKGAVRGSRRASRGDRSLVGWLVSCSEASMHRRGA